MKEGYEEFAPVVHVGVCIDDWKLRIAHRRAGHSVFTYYLLKSLRDNNSSNLDACQLYDEIKIPVANNSDQTPIFNAVKNTGDEGGQFVFRRK